LLKGRCALSPSGVVLVTSNADELIKRFFNLETLV